MSSKGYWLDALLLLMVVIWGTNFSIIKTAFRELDPQAFNAMRMAVASVALLGVMAALRRYGRRAGVEDASASGGLTSIFHTPARVTSRDWLVLLALGLVGHVCYQYFFIGGLARTSVANSSLMFASTPVVMALLSALVGEERVGWQHWLGATVSTLGIYLVVGRGMSIDSGSLTGDLMMFGAVCCWALYTLGARPLMSRHSPVGVTGLSMALGTVIYVVLLWPKVGAVNWLGVSAWTMFLLVYSALFALCVAYTIWYVAVRQIGSARTAAYSNLIPLIAMVTAVIFLHEPIGVRKILGAVCVLAGVAVARAAGPAEE